MSESLGSINIYRSLVIFIFLVYRINSYPNPLKLRGTRFLECASLPSFRREERARRSSENPYSQKWFRDRQRHISNAQKLALRDLFPIYGVEVYHGDELAVRAERRNCLDIGFGTGESLIYAAENNPDVQYVGVEMMRSGVATALQQLHKRELSNIQVVRVDATRLLAEHLPHGRLDHITVHFPDPWENEKRDSNRRVVRESSLRNMHFCLRSEGRVTIRTDVPAYASHCRALFDKYRDQWQLLIDTSYPPLQGPEHWAHTKYEKRAAMLNADASIFEIEYQKRSSDT